MVEWENRSKGSQSHITREKEILRDVLIVTEPVLIAFIMTFLIRELRADHYSLGKIFPNN